MKFEEYLNYCNDILKNPAKYPLYEDPEYFNYTKLNVSRQSRWMKKFEPIEEVKSFFNSIDEKQTWVVITEPWCGDAAHSLPQLFKLVEGNSNITFDINLRDSEPYLIDQYLTNGGKSIPKLVIRNEKGEDIALWGPRPEKLQSLFLELKSEGKEFAEIKEFVQKWYNEDKGSELQVELKALLSK